MKILDRYLLKSFTGTFLTVFVILFMIFILQTVWLFIGELAGKDLDLSLVAKFLMYKMPSVIPLVLPVLALGHVNLGYFGVLVMLNSAIGQILPPLGLNMFLVASLTGAPVLRVAKASLPFVGVLLVDLVLVLFFPVFSQGLPSLLGLSL